MSTAALIMMIVVWTVVTVLVVYFFQRVVRTPQSHDSEGTKTGPMA